MATTAWRSGAGWSGRSPRCARYGDRARWRAPLAALAASLVSLVAVGSASAAAVAPAGRETAAASSGSPSSLGAPEIAGPTGPGGSGGTASGPGCRSVTKTEIVYGTALRHGNEVVTRRSEQLPAEVCPDDPTPKVVPVGASEGGWKLVFDDEFTGNSFDSSYWTTCYPWGCTPNDPPREAPFVERESYSPGNCSVSGGDLVLTATAAPAGSGGRPYDSCLVQTYGKETFKYGYVEARIWLPGTASAFPAFWLVGASDQAQEVDILESFHGNEQVSENYHWNGGAAGNTVLLPWATTGWNTYAVDWEPGRITWYIDGTEVWQVTASTVPAKDAFLVLDLAIDSYTPLAGVPASMKVDYVRVWRKVG